VNEYYSSAFKNAKKMRVFSQKKKQNT